MITGDCGRGGEFLELIFRSLTWKVCGLPKAAVGAVNF